ncbi:MAG: TolC family protein [Acidobacteria bacterium]|nr:TolC family protein [Acidobacteriota bacterium]
MRTLAGCAVVAAGALVPAMAGAQTLPLTESQALARLSTSSPRVRAIRAGIDVARVDILSASRWPNPRVNWDRQSVSGVTEHYFTASQLLPTSGRRGLEVQAASARVAATSNRIDDDVRRLRADMRLAFADLEAAQARVQELIRARGRLRELAQVLARRESEGDAAGFDRLRAEREVLDVEADLVVATTERAQAQAALAGFFEDVTDPSQIVAIRDPAPAAPVPSVAALMETAEASRGELLALRQDLEAARLSERAAYRSLLPEPEIFVGTKSSTASSGGAGSAITVGAGATGSVIGVHTTIPLFDRARPERTLAVTRAAQAEARAEAFRLALRGQVAALRAAVVDRRESAERYRAEAVNRADDIERIARVSYDAGERGILELLDAYRIGASARVRQAGLDATVREAEIELEFVSGWEMP